ncbi:MAG TPA: hypothetical protein VNS32_14350, partial [Flavisolibacter sp.]|nr:hypothetical protein [Flavisolibacter sp.]
MSNYLYLEYEQRSLINRFDAEIPMDESYRISGLDDWHRWISLLLEVLSTEYEEGSEWRLSIRRRIWEELRAVSDNSNFNVYDQEALYRDNRSLEELILVLLLLRLKKISPPLPQNRCPRLFVSHRRIDQDYALRIAELATQNGFAFWVDVLDPALQQIANSRVAAQLIPLFTACIIEMALINCTHVIACMTPNSRGTLWIPYEYGRITELPGLGINACAWLHPDLDLTDFPEYMLLGAMTKKEMEIENWLQSERMVNSGLNCRPDIKNFSVTSLPEKT